MLGWYGEKREKFQIFLDYVGVFSELCKKETSTFDL